MAAPDYSFYEGFDTYGPVGEVNLAANIVAGEWTSTAITGSGAIAVVAALSGTGYAIQLTSASSSTSSILKTLPGNYARSLGGWTFNSDIAVASNQGIYWSDGVTAQFGISLNSSGRIEVRRGNFTATVIATSTESISANATHCIEWDITFHNSTGIIKVYLDGIITSLNLTGQDTCATANNYANGITLGGTPVSAGYRFAVDHMYLEMYTAAGGSETPKLTQPLVQTDFATSDSAVQFTFGAAVLGTAFRTTTTTNAPGANRLSLRKYTPDVAGTVSAVNIIPGATSAGAKVKPVMYGDTAGAPGSLLSTGSEIVGLTSGTTLNMPLTTPQAVVAGTQYWIGYITDTSVLLQLSDTATLGYGAANTYTSGAPGTAPAMTANLSSWLMYANMTGVAVNYYEVNKNPWLGILSYAYSSTVGQEDLFGFPALPTTPTNIYGVAIKGVMARSDAGARTVNLRMKSSATTGSGNTTAISPAISFGFVSSYFLTDPNTGVAWTPTGLNASFSGYNVNS